MLLTAQKATVAPQVSRLHVPGRAEHLDTTACALVLVMGSQVVGAGLQHARGERIPYRAYPITLNVSQFGFSSWAARWWEQASSMLGARAYPIVILIPVA